MSNEQISKLRRDLAGQTAIADLMRVLYLKRLESSIEALRNSLRHQREFQQRFLEMLQQGKLLTSHDYRRMLILEGSDDEAEETIQAFLEQLQPIDASAYDMTAIRNAVNDDLRKLDQLLNELEPIHGGKDAKLQTLIKLLQNELKDQKVLIFSYYKDTARYLYDHLIPYWQRDRVALVSSEVPIEERKRIVQRFSPQSNRYSLQPSETEIQILIATDALSEGQNLQDARVIINYDLHWNPVRMVQRIGRIDRIGSPHAVVDVYNFIPEDASKTKFRFTEAEPCDTSDWISEPKVQRSPSCEPTAAAKRTPVKPLPNSACMCNLTTS